MVSTKKLATCVIKYDLDLAYIEYKQRLYLNQFVQVENAEYISRYNLDHKSAYVLRNVKRGKDKTVELWLMQE